MSNYEPVKREDIDLDKTYCLWVTENDHEEIHEDDLAHFKETGELCHNGYEVEGWRKRDIFLEPVYPKPPPYVDYQEKCKALEKQIERLKGANKILKHHMECIATTKPNLANPIKPYQIIDRAIKAIKEVNNLTTEQGEENE